MSTTTAIHIGYLDSQIGQARDARRVIANRFATGTAQPGDREAFTELGREINGAMLERDALLASA